MAQEEIRKAQRDVNMHNPSYTGYSDQRSAAKAEKRIWPPPGGD